MPAATMLEAALSAATLLMHTVDDNDARKAFVANGAMPNAMYMSTKRSMFTLVALNGHSPTIAIRSQLGPDRALDHMRGEFIINRGKRIPCNCP